VSHHRSAAKRVSVRLARAADAPTIARFNVALADETEALTLCPETVHAGVQAVLDDPTKGVYWVAVSDDDTVVGQLMLTHEWSDWRNSFFWWIQSVYVEPQFRCQGIFNALFRFVQERASAEPEVCGLRLYVAHDNTRAQTTYGSLGMHKVEYQVFELFTSTPI
jgi:ribosomal protein S18 acetylase RimI-like enzyme